MQSLELSMIGNSSYAALIDTQGRIVWACMPPRARAPCRGRRSSRW